MPDALIPSEKRYIDFCLNPLKKVPGLVVFDPTELLVESKQREGLLYYRVDTHWGAKGAYIAYSAFLEAIDLLSPKGTFEAGDLYAGDLVSISNA